MLLRFLAVIALAMGATNAWGQVYRPPVIPQPPPIVVLPPPPMQPPSVPPTLEPPPRVIIDPPVVVVPPSPPVAEPAPDSGDADACDCYETVQVPTIDQNGKTVWHNERRWTGQKAPACCPQSP